MRSYVLLVVGLVTLATGCMTTNCDDAGCVGKRVTVALVDDSGAPVNARGELSYAHHWDRSFDCSLESNVLNDADCEDGVLTLESVLNADDTLKVRFEREDGSVTDWQPVELKIEKKVHRDFNGPDCDCTAYEGTAEPVLVPEEAR
jgi:hypothetical protein